MNHNFIRNLKEMAQLPDDLKEMTQSRDKNARYLERLVNYILAERPFTDKDDYGVFHTNEQGHKLMFRNHVDGIRAAARKIIEEFK